MEHNIREREDEEERGVGDGAVAGHVNSGSTFFWTEEIQLARIWLGGSTARTDGRTFA